MSDKAFEVSIGRSGELIAAGILETFGYRTVLCQQRNFDLLLMKDDTHYYRVEVKSCSKESKAYQSQSSRYEFSTCTGSASKKPLDADKVDLLVLVALDIRRCYFVPVCDHRSVRKNISRGTIMEVDEDRQLSDALDRIEEYKCGKH